MSLSSIDWFDVIVPAGDGADLAQKLRTLAGDLDYLVAVVDSGQTRAHEIDKIFIAIAQQIPWEQLAHRVVMRAILESGLKTASEEPTISSLADSNDVDEGSVRMELRRWFYRHILQDHLMSQEFRHAMSAICLEPLTGRVGPETLHGNVLDWLQGELRLQSGVKPAQIYRKITIRNARDLFISLGHWSRAVGKAGLVVILDIRACAVGRRSESGGGLFYNRSQVIQMYDTLRQFIDSTDDLESTFVAVIASPDFVADETRGMMIYEALRMRVDEEVKDRARDNPMATLVRLV
jgi:hypothetical protein